MLSEVGRRTEALPPAAEAVELYRGLAADNPAYTGNLAGALSNLGIRLSQLGRRTEALPPTAEAVDLYRALAADNPAYTGNLATALTNLGIRLSEVGRPADALPPVIEAVGLYRGLAADNPAFISSLASALSNLGDQLHQNDRDTEIEPAWQEALGALPPTSWAAVLFYRAAYAQAGQLKAAAWLQQALDAAGDDRSLQTALHEQARRHREPDPASFDAAWLAGAGPPLPGWLTVDPDLLQAARAWITTDTYEAERDYLTAHPELLASDADAAVTEALLDLDSEEAQRFEELRAAARTEGVEAAYRPLLLRVLAHEFIAADTGEQRQLLSQRRDDLLDDIVASELDRLAAADDQQVAVAAVAAGALVELARIDQHEPALAALESEAGFTPLLRDLARTPDSTPLAPTATLALVHASNATNAATARLYLAIAAATTDDLVVAGEQLDQAIASDPNQLPDWIAELAALGAQQPQVLALIPQLTTALTTSTPPSATATREQMSEG